MTETRRCVRGRYCTPSGQKTRTVKRVRMCKWEFVGTKREVVR